MLFPSLFFKTCIKFPMELRIFLEAIGKFAYVQHLDAEVYLVKGNKHLSVKRFSILVSF